MALVRPKCAFTVTLTEAFLNFALQTALPLHLLTERKVRAAQGTSPRETGGTMAEMPLLQTVLQKQTALLQQGKGEKVG